MYSESKGEKMEQLHQIEINKFQDNQIVLRFGETISEKSAVIRLILALMLVDRSKNYPTKQALNYQIDMLYGTSLQANAFNIGYLHIVEISFKFLKDNLVKTNNLEKAITFLADLLYYPALNNKSFLEARDNVLEMLLRQADNPNQHNLIESLKIAGENYPLGINNLGDENLLNEITLKDIKEAYQRLISENRFDILLVGETSKKTKELFEKQFVFTDAKQLKSYYNFQSHGKKEIVLKRDVNQTYITLVYNTTISKTDDDYYKLLVANAILGQFSSSLLFQEIREKMSLCYSIRSMVLSNDGVVLINAGIKNNSEQLVIETINDIFNQIINQTYDQSLLNTSKKLLVNRYLASEDHSGALINRYYMSLLTNQYNDLKNIIEKINVVTLNEVSQVVSDLLLNTIVILKEEDNND